ncbi:RES domain-containing protein [Salinibacter ruber]|uniref:RES family NAD+ phosphorylase n=1 Tax=Salinibacter ruber TaxID=146919 RepID=UPI00216775BA|nr:RES family NAD+ phosphorylase [Salinibacter ruber]MCS3628734.1 RES domain-containing protein [Salinibacter ruber]MCS4145643.1 RES domain-containing protein [Salinibacter ruber]
MADLTVWRPVEEQYSGSAFSGEGARQHGGRFNSPGISVVYTAGSLPLALVEMMTGLERYDQLRRYMFFRVGIPQGQLSKLEAEDLPDGWDRHPPSSRSQRIGDRWVSRGESAVLRASSVAVPYSYNYILNPLHEAFDDIEIGQAEPFPVDERLIPDR